MNPFMDEFVIPALSDNILENLIFENPLYKDNITSSIIQMDLFLSGKETYGE